MTDWLKYEWEWNEQEAVFQVDLQYWELLPTLGYSQLVFVSVAPRDPEASAFSRSEERRATALQHLLAEQIEDAAIFVGGIGMKALIQFYFYTSDEALIHRVSAICRAETKLLSRIPLTSFRLFCTAAQGSPEAIEQIHAMPDS